MARVRPDVVIEATGVAGWSSAPCAGPPLRDHRADRGLVTGPQRPVDAGALNRDIVLENDVVVGSVNANRRHYAQARTRWRPPTSTGWAGW